jgi:hypothetical protein
MPILIWLAIFGAIGGATYLPAATATLAGALVFGSLWFWGLISLATLALFTFIDHDDGVGATLTLFAFVALEQLFGGVPILAYVKENPLHTFELVASYFAVGTLWGIGKWWFHVREQRRGYDKAKKEFLTFRGIDGTDIPSSLKKAWADKAPERPEAAESKAMIMRWMTFWPWSFIWTMINDPVKRLFKAIFRNIQSLLQKIVDRVYADTNKDF